MVHIYKTQENRLTEIKTFEDDIWVNLVNPTEEEILSVCSALQLDPDKLRAALDEEERAHIDNDDGQTLIIVDIPIVDKENVYSTIPLGIVLFQHVIVTVCLKEDTLLNDFLTNRVKGFFTQYKTRFVLQLLYRNATRYLQYLKHIDKMSSQIESDLHKSMKNKELIQMLKLEKSLVYFTTSLRSNEVVLERLMRHEYIKKYPEDVDLLEDVITENKQAIEMANIYGSILSGTMDAFASIISNNLNIVMKFLASVTIVMAIPTIISGFFGMNVTLPAGLEHGFWFIIVFSLIMCAIVGGILYKKKMF